ncbi:MAG: transposase [Chloroflexi bacterium]|nr:transposase [Chloroflexota bacterium]
MLTLPSEIIAVLRTCAPVFSARVWERAIVLLAGTTATPGQRTVSRALRVTGLQAETHFQNYHRVLNRAQWPSRALGSILLGPLVAAFWTPEAPAIIGIHETISKQARDLCGKPAQRLHPNRGQQLSCCHVHRKNGEGRQGGSGFVPQVKRKVDALPFPPRFIHRPCRGARQQRSYTPVSRRPLCHRQAGHSILIIRVISVCPRP